MNGLGRSSSSSCCCCCCRAEGEEDEEQQRQQGARWKWPRAGGSRGQAEAALAAARGSATASLVVAVDHLRKQIDSAFSCSLLPVSAAGRRLNRRTKRRRWGQAMLGRTRELGSSAGEATMEGKKTRRRKNAGRPAAVF